MRWRHARTGACRTRRASSGSCSRRAGCPYPEHVRVGVPKETKTAEARVALTPDGVRELRHHGHDVVVEAAAGEGSAISDAQFAAAGARIASAEEAWAADMVVKVKEPQPAEYGYLRADLVLFTYLHLAAYPAVARALLD